MNAHDRDRIREFADNLADESGNFYYENRHTHQCGIDYVAGYADALEEISRRLAGFAEETTS